MLIKKQTADIIRNPEFENFFSKVNDEELIANIQNALEHDPPKVDCNFVLFDGYRRLKALLKLGLTEIDVLHYEHVATIEDRIKCNTTRVLSVEDQVKMVRQAFITYPKRQGKKSTDSKPYVRDVAISNLLNGRFKGDDIIRKLDLIQSTPIENDILMKGLIGKGWKVDTCNEFITVHKEIDENNKYGFTKQLIEGEIDVSDAVKLIDQRHQLDSKYEHTFSIPEKATVYNADSRELSEVLKGYSRPINLLFTSIMYWMLRHYKVGETRPLGHEKDKHEFAMNIAKIFQQLVPLLSESANVCINVGETYNDGVAQGIPFLIKEYIEKHTSLIYKDNLIWSKINPHPTNEDVKRPSNSIEYILWFVVDPKKAKYNMLTFPVEGKEAKVTQGVKDVTHIGKVAKKQKSISKPYGKLLSHIREQEVEEIITSSVGKNHEVCQISSAGHPASMSPYLPTTMILMMSDEGDLVCDPFSGGATTGKISLLLNRNYLGIEKSKEYFDIGNEILINADKEFNKSELEEVNQIVFPNKAA